LNETLSLLNNKDISHDNSITSIESAISVLQSADIIHDSAIQAINTNVGNLENDLTTKQDIINGSNL
jgi:hypothetical protein